MFFLLYGEDGFSTQKKLESFKKKFSSVNRGNTGATVISGDDLTEERVVTALFASTLIGGGELIIIKNFFQQFGGSELEKKISDSIDDIDDDKFVVFVEDKAVKPTSLFKKLDVKKRAQKFDLPTGSKLVNWIKTYVISEGSTIDDSAAYLLGQSIGPNLHRLSNEVQKLAQASSHIDSELINKLVVTDRAESIFNLVDAVGAKDQRAAVTSLLKLTASGETPNGILGMLTNSFERLIKIKSLKDSSKKDFEIQALSGIHSYVIKKSLGVLKRYSAVDLKRNYIQLCEIDTGIRSGSVDAQGALENFIFQLSV